jgi:tRNA1Val (adenine37-N6)-methyltransferase
MKSKSHFHFKNFSVAHARSTMKVGTDAVLLGAWANVNNAKHVLDIGTGNGTIALMLAQRTTEITVIDAVEIEEIDFVQAQENFIQSPWAHRIHVHHYSIQDYYPGKLYDVVVSNPPYFNKSQKPPDGKRSQTRHTITLSYDELLVAAIRLLTDVGSFNVILPYAEGLQFMELAKRYGLFCLRQFSFQTREHKPIERWLLEYSKKSGSVQTGEILLYKEGDDWSDSYRMLTKDFYLKI